MSDKISIVICNDYKIELKLVRPQDGFEDFTVIHFPASQNDPIRCDHSEKFINNLLQKYQTTHLIGGSCLSLTNKTFRE